MPDVLLAGAFGQGNLGDEALMEAFVSALPGWDFTVTTMDPIATESIGCRAVSPRNPLAVVRAAATSDAIVVGGGTIFKTLRPASHRRPHSLLANAAALVGLSSLTRKPIALVGVGSATLDDRRSRALARFITGHSDLMILRDEESADALSSAAARGPFRVGADPAWTLLPVPDARSVHEESVRVIPSMYAVGSDGLSGLIDRLSVAIGGLLAAGLTVQIQPWQRPTSATSVDDQVIVDEVAARFDSAIEVLPKPASIAQASRSMVGCGALVSFRFHGLLAAAAAGVPAVAVVHEAKLGAMARRLEQRAAAVDFEPATLVTQVLSVLRAQGPAPAVIKEQIDMAEESFRLLRVLLSGGQSDEADTLGALPLAPRAPLS